MDDAPSAPQGTGGSRHVAGGPATAAAGSRAGRASRELMHRHRRRRAGALAGIASVALVLGIAVGGATGARGGRARSAHGSRQPSGHLSRRGAPSGSGPGSSSAAAARADNVAIDRTLAYTPYVRMAGTQHRQIALTFDDGPGPYTPKILAVLQRTHTPATFFEVGEEDRYFAASTARIVARGDPIGDHTETHPPMSQLSARDQERQLLEETEQTGDSGAPFPRMFRPPYGQWDDTTLRLLKRYHMLMVLWSVDTEDWRRPGTRAIVSAALQGAKPGAIILMHDAGGDRTETVAALPRIIRTLRHRGYALVTVPRLLLDNPAPRHQDVAAVRGQGG